ncbi:MAG: hypothetical protein FWC70_02425 [Defluviitaleaceae bacterium]|nr:hypothetical protein [Defluviitaleaceae bacterium]
MKSFKRRRIFAVLLTMVMVASSLVVAPVVAGADAGIAYIEAAAWDVAGLDAEIIDSQNVVVGEVFLDVPFSVTDAQIDIAKSSFQAQGYTAWGYCWWGLCPVFNHVEATSVGVYFSWLSCRPAERKAAC